MPADRETNPQGARENANVQAIATGISEVVNAALSVGAAVARTVAEATSPSGGSARPGTPGEGPFADIVHYSVEAALNFARLVVRGMPSTVRPASSGSETAAAPGYPSVHAGSTLRIPLSIENPSDVEMSQMTFYCGSLSYEGKSAGAPLAAAAFVFEPATLTIGPHDFEKVTVFITTSENTASGTYEAQIMVHGATFRSALHFQVLPAAQA
jgi:hypothetical protein